MSIDPLIPKADAMAASLTAIAGSVPKIARKLVEQHSGYPAGGQATTSGSSDRTGELAVRHLDDGHETTDLDYRRLYQITEAMERLATEIDDIARRTAPNNKASAYAATLTEDEPGCRSCARVKTWSRPRRRGMCSGCLDIQNRVITHYEWPHDMPPVSLVELQRRGKDATVKRVHEALRGRYPAAKPEGH